MKKSAPIIVTGDNIQGESVIIAESIKMFDDIKGEFTRLCCEKNACSSGLREVDHATDVDQLSDVIKKHARWLFTHKVIDADWLERNLGKETLHRNHIYASGTHDIRLTEGKADILTCGTSSANVETWDTSSANVETWDTSSANVKTCGTSSANVKTCGTSSALIGQYHSSTMTHSLGEGSCPLIKHVTERKVFVKTSDYQIVQVN